MLEGWTIKKIFNAYNFIKIDTIQIIRIVDNEQKQIKVQQRKRKKKQFC